MAFITHLFLQDQEFKKLQPSIAFVTIAISLFAIFLTIIFFIFNIRYRNFRLIKMSSPNINNIINFNCIILYLCPIFNSIKGLNINNEPLANSMCQINAWVLPMSSTAIYAAMLAKAWRIYKIFDTTPKMKKVVIKDLRLVIYIMCMVLVDVIVLTIWQLVDTVKLKSRYVYESQSQSSSQIVLPPSYSSKYSFFSSTSNILNVPLNNTNPDPFNSITETTTPIIPNFDPNTPIIQNFSLTNQLKVVLECNSNYNEVWITILTMYKIILLMYGIYLAWIIRNINVPSMNDSKYLLLSTYTIIVSGLGSLTLIQLLRDWPDVVQTFFTIGVVLATCTTQCLLFIPKIRLWYKRRNDDNFKISLSQIFLQSSSSCYYSDKQSRNSTNTSTGNMLNLEDELCELLQENSQLKNYLKEKEEIIKLLQEKIRTTKANLFQQVNNANQTNANDKNDSGIDVDGAIMENRISNQINNELKNQNVSYLNYPYSTQQHANNLNQNIHLNKNVNNESAFDIDSSTCTATTTTEIIKPNTLSNNGSNDGDKINLIPPGNINNNNNNSHKNGINFEKTKLGALKNDLDEVEELTSRVRDSISIDLSNTRRYSPLLYEYYRKQLELAKSIQCTYNIQCNTLFDAMTLMRKCLKDYCQTVHNPEYLAIDEIQNEKFQYDNLQNQFSFNDYIKKNQQQQINLQSSSTLPSQSAANVNNLNRLFQMGLSSNANNSKLSISNSISSTNRNIKKIFLSTNAFLNANDSLYQTKPAKTNNFSTNMSANNMQIDSGSSASASSSSLSNSFNNINQNACSIMNTSSSNLNSNSNSTSTTNTATLNQQASCVATIDNKQTYV